jgi:hypothetical protein
MLRRTVVELRRLLIVVLMESLLDSSSRLLRWKDATLTASRSKASQPLRL